MPWVIDGTLRQRSESGASAERSSKPPAGAVQGDDRGQQMVNLLKARGVPARALTRSQILNGNNTLQLDSLTSAQRDSLATNTPLWFYILREAELNDGKLRGRCAHRPAETFHRAIQGSKFSIARDTDFRPSLGPDNATFRMVDLTLFAFEGKKQLLDPLG